eukprot:Gregarina_sp_Poly_1__135@NODE_102_length_14381_cov_59_883820_g89_i0_p10_GENE_NODE_102_length_14381_cov_59_883820_g89_i0NODE_102_length_14381_cov_59_883820_g89_i0_p10_ORF_typecomplete_len129_score20_23_NODE_102_length_14381_cov_59_883820_g89_i076462
MDRRRGAKNATSRKRKMESPPERRPSRKRSAPGSKRAAVQPLDPNNRLASSDVTCSVPRETKMQAVQTVPWTRHKIRNNFMAHWRRLRTDFPANLLPPVPAVESFETESRMLLEDSILQQVRRTLFNE